MVGFGTPDFRRLSNNNRNMKDLYNKEYLKNLLSIIKDNIEDLAKWSIYNDDKGNYELGMFNLNFKNLQKLLLKEDL